MDITEAVQEISEQWFWRFPVEDSMSALKLVVIRIKDEQIGAISQHWLLKLAMQIRQIPAKVVRNLKKIIS